MIVRQTAAVFYFRKSGYRMEVKCMTPVLSFPGVINGMYLHPRVDVQTETQIL